MADLLVAVALGSALVATAMPAVASARERATLDAAARHLVLLFRTARLEAVRRGVAVAVQFSGDPTRPWVRLVADGNGNGVRNEDLVSGVDRPLNQAQRFVDHHPRVAFTVGCACPGIEGGDIPRPGAPGLRFGTTGLVVFAPRGSGTAGTAYLSAGSALTYAIRVNGVTGRARVLAFEPGRAAWVPR